jgi:cytoskeletal protein RodZ
MGLKMDLGTELRQARERRGMSLAVLAGSTKIGVANLQAMERGDFGRLPGGVFTRGFLRAYAHEVGLDPQETVENYLAEFEPLPAEPVAPQGDAQNGEVSPAAMEELERRNQRKQLVAGAVILLVSPLLYFTFLGRHSGVTPSLAAQSPPPPAVTPARADVDTAGVSEMTRPASGATSAPSAVGRIPSSKVASGSGPVKARRSSPPPPEPSTPDAEEIAPPNPVDTPLQH